MTLSVELVVPEKNNEVKKQRGRCPVIVQSFHSSNQCALSVLSDMLYTTTPPRTTTGRSRLPVGPRPAPADLLQTPAAPAAAAATATVQFLTRPPRVVAELLAAG